MGLLVLAGSPVDPPRSLRDRAGEAVHAGPAGAEAATIGPFAQPFHVVGWRRTDVAGRLHQGNFVLHGPLAADLDVARRPPFVGGIRRRAWNPIDLPVLLPHAVLGLTIRKIEEHDPVEPPIPEECPLLDPQQPLRLVAGGDQEHACFRLGAPLEDGR